MWENGSIPTELGCTVLVMIPKGNTDTRGIGLLGVVWKVVEAVIDTRIKTGVQFDDVSHGFVAERGARNAIIELKLSHDLEIMDQYSLFLVLIDLRKDCDNLEFGRLLKKLEGYGEGPKQWGIDSMSHNYNQPEGKLRGGWPLLHSSMWHWKVWFNTGYHLHWRLIFHSLRTRDGSGNIYGCVLCGLWPREIKGPVVSSMGHQCTYQNLPKS